MENLKHIMILSSLQKQDQLFEKFESLGGKDRERKRSTNLQNIFRGKDVPPGYIGGVILEYTKLLYIPAYVTLKFPPLLISPDYKLKEWIPNRSGISILDNLKFSGDIKHRIEAADDYVKRLDKTMKDLKQKILDIEFEVTEKTKRLQETRISLKRKSRIHPLKGTLSLSMYGITLDLVNPYIPKQG